MTAPRRYAAIVCFLWQSYRDAVDQCIDMYDKLLTRLQSQVKFNQLQALQQQRKRIKASLLSFRQMGEIVLDESIHADLLRERLFNVVARDELEMQIEAVTDWTTGKHSDVLPGVIQRYSYIRRFSPAFINSISLSADDPGHCCMQALALLRELTTLGYALAFFFGSSSLRRRALLLVAAMPVALAMNILRIIGLCFLAKTWGVDYAGRGGLFGGHTLMNVAEWVLDLAVLLAIDFAIDRRRRQEAE